MMDIRDKAHGYLSRCLQALYPKIEILPDLLGVCTQIDNVLAGQQAEIKKLREALREIEYLDRPQVRGMPHRKTIQEIARAALGEKE